MTEFPRAAVTPVPDLIAQQAAATARAMSLDADRKLAEPLIEEWRSLTWQQRQDRIDQAAAERERRDREFREEQVRREQAARERHATALDRATDPALRAVVALHRPHVESWGSCPGCVELDYDETEDERSTIDMPDWPCRTFLLIEGALS